VGAISNRWLKVFPEAKLNTAEYLIDGEAYFKSVVEAIKTTDGPDHYIYILGWMLDVEFKLTPQGPTLSEVLLEASKRNVEIRILIWDNPLYLKKTEKSLSNLNQLANTECFTDSATFTHPFLRKKIKAFFTDVVKLIEDNSKGLIGMFLEDRNTKVTGDVTVKDLESWIIRADYSISAHHEKNVIIKGNKGLIGYCGGMDFNKNRVEMKIKDKVYHRTPHYHDVACKLKGPATFVLLEKFKTRWRNHPKAKSIDLTGNNETEPQDETVITTRNATEYLTYAKIVGTYNNPTGGDTDRSFSDAYLKIIDNAQHYLYIEDQYLVDLGVAKRISKKIREARFKFVLLVVQDSDESSDLVIPNRKRAEFINAITRGASKNEKSKVIYTVLDKTNYKKELFHPGIHSKILIADDDIAIIGSGNVNRRAFSMESETSVVLFGGTKTFGSNIAQNLRISLWQHALRSPVPQKLLKNWIIFPAILKKQITNLPATPYLKIYTSPNKEDLEKIIIDVLILLAPHPIIDSLSGQDKDLFSLVKIMSRSKIRKIVDIIFHLDGTSSPKGDGLYDYPKTYAQSLTNILWKYIIDP